MMLRRTYANGTSRLLTGLTAMILLATTVESLPEETVLEARKELNAIGQPFTAESFAKAVSQNDGLAVELYLAAGMGNSEHGMTAAIAAAVESDHVRMFQLLSDTTGLSLSEKVVLAAHGGAPAILKLLVERGATPNTQVALLAIRAKRRNQHTLRVLLDAGLEPTADLLVDAVRAGQPEVVRMLADADTRCCPSGLLGTVIANAQLDLIGSLKDAGARATDDDWRKVDGLKRAPFRATVNTLLDAGFVPTSRILARAAYDGDIVLVEAILNAGTTPTWGAFRDAYWAVHHGDKPGVLLGTARLLFDHGLRPSTPTDPEAQVWLANTAEWDSEDWRHDENYAVLKLMLESGVEPSRETCRDVRRRLPGYQKRAITLLKPICRTLRRW